MKTMEYIKGFLIKSLTVLEISSLLNMRPIKIRAGLSLKIGAHLVFKILNFDEIDVFTPRVYAIYFFLRELN